MSHKTSLIYGRQNQALTLDTVNNIFNNIDIKKLSTIAPIKPCGEEIYVYKIFKYQKKEFWKDDHYRWQCKGRKLIPRKNPVYKKYYFDIRLGQITSSDFQRHAYYAILMDNNPYVIVHYLGEHTKVGDSLYFPEPTPEMLGYCRVLPGFLQEAFVRYAQGGSSSYMDDNDDMTYSAVMVDTNTVGSEHSILPTLDVNGTISAASEETVETTGYTIAQDGTVSLAPILMSLQQQPMTVGKELAVDKSALFHSYQMAHLIKEFIWKMDLFPEILIIAGAKPLLEEVNRILMFQSPLPQLISYDSRFQVGDFFISPILMRHIAFEGAPVIPAMFLIHETKEQKHRDEVFPYVNNLMPALNEVRHPFVTYKERRIMHAAMKYLPQLPLWYGWDEVLSEVRRWLHNNNVEEADFSFYLDNLQDLFDSESYADYQTKLDEFKLMWPEHFKKFYFKRIHPDVNVHIGSWLFINHGVYSPYTGIMKNESSHLTMVLKCLQKWKNVPLDIILQALYYLQIYSFEAIKLGYNAKGSFSLLPNCSHLKLDKDTPCDTENSSLEEVIQDMCTEKNLEEQVFE